MRNREALPEYLQKRDMTRLGRKGATKYKDMRTEDTGRWGQQLDDAPARRGAAFRGDDRFRPDDGGPRGANAVPLRDARRRDGGGRDGDGRDAGDGRRRAPRSPSPRQHGDDHGARRKRSTSRDRDGYDDKRRRVDVDARS